MKKEKKLYLHRAQGVDWGKMLAEHGPGCPLYLLSGYTKSIRSLFGVGMVQNGNNPFSSLCSVWNVLLHSSPTKVLIKQ